MEILSQEDGANWLMVGPDGGLKVDLTEGSRSAGALASAAVITDGIWHRVGLVWGESHQTLYVDGIEMARDTQGKLTGSAGGLHMGTGSTPVAGTFWWGLIDDVRIYSRAVGRWYTRRS